MRRLVVEIDEGAFARLVRWALRDRRPTRDQAAVLLERAIRSDIPVAEVLTGDGDQSETAP